MLVLRMEALQWNDLTLYLSNVAVKTIYTILLICLLTFLSIFVICLQIKMHGRRGAAIGYAIFYAVDK